MKHLRKHIKLIAAFLVVNFLSSMFAANIAYALTSGPNTPETASFEPVDTTDMVNTLTGDLAYNIPLLEVPGPAGGYPLSLSYHGGVLAEEEASWVGLGWSLNPGAINRTVNGWADDHDYNDVINRFFWEGGETETLEVGVQISPTGDGPNVSAGLSFGRDTYQGFGIGGYVGLGLSFGENDNFGVNARLGVDPWGNPSAGVGVSGGGGQGSFGVSASVGVSTNFESISANGGVGLGGGPSKDKAGNRLKGVSLGVVSAGISSRGSGPSLSVLGGGVGQVHNNNSGKISTRTTGFSLPIPLIDIRYNYVRYWIDQRDVIETHGSLYDLDETKDWEHFDNNSYDSYHIFDPSLDGGIVENAEAGKIAGGTFPDVDSYSVSGQGVGGSMRPYFYNKYLSTQTKTDEIINNQLGSTSDRAEFRMIGEFSNKHLYDDTDAVNFNTTDRTMSYAFDGTRLTGENDSDGFSHGRLSAATHIEYWTNQEIRQYTGHLETPGSVDVQRALDFGFLENESLGYDRSTDPDDLVGGFIITNASGVKYHYTLPAYAYNEIHHSENIEKAKEENGHTGSTTARVDKYAYTWHLTAVTGPDFVDRGTIGKLDEADWGYWVNLNYGKWADDSRWRNPAEGSRSDFDREFQSNSLGFKEVYYLNTIQTATHTAMFAKEMRNDAKGMSRSWSLYFSDWNETSEPLAPPSTGVEIYVNEPTTPTSALGLKAIYLFENDELPAALNNGSLQDLMESGAEEIWEFTDSEGNDHSLQVHQNDNVLEYSDIQTYGALFQNSALRKIDFGTDYSLRPNAPNSYKLKPTNNGWANKTGALTLNSLTFRGHGGASLPSMKFSYDKQAEFYQGTMSMSNDVVNLSTTAGDLVEGDLLKIEEGYYLVLEDLGSNQFEVQYVDGTEVHLDGGSVLATFQTTKNPPFNSDMRDSWGFYKADFSKTLAEKNENLGRVTTPLSAKSTDVWSLSKVRTSLGADISIEYESDTYANVFQEDSKPFQILDSKNINYTSETFEIDVDFPFGNNAALSSYFLNKGINLDILASARKLNSSQLEVSYYELISAEGTVTGVSGNTLTVSSPEFFADLPDTSAELPPTTTLEHLIASTVELEGNFYLKPPVGFVGNPNISGFLNRYGGGLRCSAISITNPITNVVNVTSYDIDFGNGFSSGTTPYEPTGMDQYGVDFINGLGNENLTELEEQNDAKDELKKKLFENFSHLLSNVRELPAPGVMYTRTAVRESVVHADGTEEFFPNYSTYEFEGFSSAMTELDQPGQIETILSDPNTEAVMGSGFPFPVKTVKKQNVTLTNQIGRVGSLKRTTIRKTDGDDLLSETQNHFLHDLDDVAHLTTFGSMLNDQGIIEEQFVNSRLVQTEEILTYGGNEVYAYDIVGVVSKRIEIPVVNLGSSTINYKTGITTTTRNLGFDFYSGHLTETYSEDGYGNKYVTKAVPAYRLQNAGGSAYPEMGMMATDPTNKNMLGKDGASYAYQVDSNFDFETDFDYTNNITGVVGASLQTWDDDHQIYDGAVDESTGYPSGIYRQKSSYTFIGDTDPNHVLNNGLFDPAHFSEATLLADNSFSETDWQKSAEVHTYDVNSHALQATDVNGNYAATKLDNENVRVFSTAANARYDEFAFSGAEDEPISGIFGGGVTLEGIRMASDQTNEAHTGLWHVRTTSNTKALSFTGSSSSNRTYRLQFWATSNLATVELDAVAVSATELGNYGGQYLMQAIIPISSGSFEVAVKGVSGTSVYFDDFRISPVDAAMTSYVYNDWGELSHVLDANNLYTHYEYDGMGRLEKVTRETLQYGPVKTSESEIIYSRGN